MSPPNDERRYSDEEFALILRTASEVEDSPTPAPALAPPQEGLTLPEIQEIAQEVGIDPHRVSRAAMLLSAGETETLVRLAGGPVKYRHEHVIRGELTAEDMIRVIEVARREFETQGESREVMGALEWRGSTGGSSSVSVSLTPRGGETTLQTYVNRTEPLLGVFGGVGLPVAGIIGVTLGKLVFGESDAGIAAAFFSGLAPAMLFARVLWKRSTKKWKERLLRLMDAMAREAEDAARRKEEDEEGPAEDA
ncbi:MAG: hypothetical protein KAJ42_13825 [Gemmatimonadetes bacterium]|nr:hypothetical protein [Gemmatimonadota bacterium]